MTLKTYKASNNAGRMNSPAQASPSGPEAAQERETHYDN